MPANPELSKIAALAQELMAARGVEFYSPGGSLQRRLGVLLFKMATGNSRPGDYAALLDDVQVRVALHQLADWVARNLKAGGGNESP